MLRRKLLIFLSAIVGLLLAVAIAAIWLLQGVLVDLDHAGREDAAVVDDATQMSVLISEIEIELREIQVGRERHLDALIDQIDALHLHTQRFGAEYGRALPEGKANFERIQKSLPVFERHIAMLATTEDAALSAEHTNQAMTASVELRKEIQTLSRMMRTHVAREQADALAWFRWLVLGLAIVFLLVINISVMMLMRMSHMILRPVDQLVDASRRMAQEDFSVRVKVAQDDEFGELARAYNHLADELQAIEQRKLETLAQTSVMLNHELNNASAIIKLQLRLIERQSGGNSALERSLRQINESLARMTAVLEALKHVRRIVLTDYGAGTKMLDLQRSVQEEPAALAGSPDETV